MKRCSRIVFACSAVLSMALVPSPRALEKRERATGLSRSLPSATIGRGNLYLTVHGRAFLWDNQAANKVPTALPHFEVGYGVLDYVQAEAGLLVMTTKPGLAYLRLKATTPNTKNIRLLGMAQTIEFYKNLTNEFKSNGYRYRNEGFTPDFFLLGNEAPITFYRAITTLDVELIRLWTRLPIKLYLNAGAEFAFESWMRDNWERALDDYAEPKRSLVKGTADFTKIPVSGGVELKTQATDFFVEFEYEPFWQNVLSLFRGVAGGREDAAWVRYNAVLQNRGVPSMKIFDVHYLELPMYLNAGARLKYPGGLTLMGGFSWMLSVDKGPHIGPCGPANPCRQGAGDGYSPFYPQWRILGELRVPLKFQQTSAELYRTYLLRKNRLQRKVLDIDSRLEAIERRVAEEIELPLDLDDEKGGGRAQPR